MRAADESYWDHRVLLPAPTAHRLQLGERSALFCARRQQLYELNPTADAIWQAIASEREPGAAADALSRDADRTQVLDFVRQAVSAWMRGGQLVPAEILSLKAHDELDFVLD